MGTLPKILTSLLVTGIVASSVVMLSGAFFSDTETSSGNTFQAGALDLKIDNTSYYNGTANSGTTWTEDNLPGHLFFDFNDLKPGDWGEDTISLHVENNAWACMKMTITKNDDNTCTEPELQPLNDPSCTEPDADLTDGELDKHVEIVFWADDGDNVLEDNEFPHIFKKGNLKSVMDGQNITLTDSASGIWPTPDPIPGGQTLYIGKAWCFGLMGVAPVAQGQGVNPTVASGITCDGAPLNNAAQSDVLTADIEFTAIQSRNNPGFLCNSNITPTPTISVTPTPTPPSEPYADAVPTVSGTFGHCCDTNDLSSSPAVAAASLTGAPDSPPNSNFIQISHNDSVVLEFVNNRAIDGSGNDVRVYTYDTLYPATAKIELSDDCSSYVDFGNHLDTANVDLDINGSGLSSIRCIRITNNEALSDPGYPTLGFDVDAAEAINSIVFP